MSRTYAHRYGRREYWAVPKVFKRICRRLERAKQTDDLRKDKELRRIRRSDR